MSKFSAKQKNFLLHKKLKRLAIINTIIATIWTLLFILPTDFSQSLLRILVGGGPGVWLIIGYVLFIVVGCLGLIGLSIIVSDLDETTIRSVNIFLMIGIVMFYVGTIGSTLGLGLAGALGGYSSTILHAPVANTETILQPFEKPIQVFTAIAIIGVYSCFYFAYSWIS